MSQVVSTVTSIGQPAGRIWVLDSLTLNSLAVLSIQHFPANRWEGTFRGSAMNSPTRCPVDRELPASVALEALGGELNANQYRAVHLAARYDDELEWFHQGLAKPALGIARRLQLHTSTAREWIRIGHSLRDLPEIDASFRHHEISYAKVRILTRWADPGNETQLLQLARERSANRLTTAIAHLLAGDEDESERDQRHHDTRCVTSFTDGEGMVVIRVVLPPTSAKPILAAVDALVDRIAQLPAEEPIAAPSDPPADASGRHRVTEPHHLTTQCGRHAPADASAHSSPSLQQTLADVRQKWPARDDGAIPSLGQQRADAFTVLFSKLDVAITTEVVIHMRGDGNTFDDGIPITTNAITRQLDQAFIRLLLHDAERRPVNASSKRRHPTTRQKRVVLETHHHECVDCASTDLLEFDHNPPYTQTRRTVTSELEPRCAPCHRSRHRIAA